MIGTLLIGGILSLIIAAGTAYLLLKIVRQELALLRSQLLSQEAQQQRWREIQEQRIFDLQQKVLQQVNQFQDAQKTREEAENTRFDSLLSEYEAVTKKARLEYELAQLPRIEDIPLPGQNHQNQNAESRRSSPNLQGQDLSGRDLSSRYLSHADLHQTNLSHTKLYMADLSGADLSGADLSGADLTATNLTETNLRGATLRGANLLVADLNRAVFIGSDLRETHGLSSDQITTAIYDRSTQFDRELSDKIPASSSTPMIRPLAAAQEAIDQDDANWDTSRMKAVRKYEELHSSPSEQMAPTEGSPSAIQPPSSAPISSEIMS